MDECLQKQLFVMFICFFIMFFEMNLVILVVCCEVVDLKIKDGLFVYKFGVFEGNVVEYGVIYLFDVVLEL